MAVIDGVNPTDLAQAGWGILFAENSDPAIRDALRPLLELRRAQATTGHGTRYREFVGPSGYRSGDTKLSFLARVGAGPGPVDPEKVPYYLLLVGDPAIIPYSFELSLGLQHAVGRIHFYTLEEYAQYAHSVLEVEVRNVQTVPHRIVLFGTQQDEATEDSSNKLVKPIAGSLQNDATWETDTYIGESATKENLKNILGGSLSPTLIFAACHALRFRSGSPRQQMLQGALVCQDWPGWEEGPPAKEAVFSADDVDESAQLLGMLVILWGEYSVGTDAQLKSGLEVAPNSFTARLPQRLLSHESGGALAVIGSTGHRWRVNLEKDARLYELVLRDLMKGHQVGFVVEHRFRARYAELAVDLSSRLEVSLLDPYVEMEDDLWREMDNQRVFVFGDPAVRIFRGNLAQSAEPSQVISSGVSTPSLRSPQIGSLRGAVNDRVAAQDQLAFRHYIATFADLIESPYTAPPLTIGVYGSWGSGKSFLMEHIAQTLEQRRKERELQARAPASPPVPRIHVVRFNAWEYGANELIWPGLVRKIMDYLEELLSPKQHLRVAVLRFWRASKRELRQSKFGWLALVAFCIALIVFLVWEDAEQITLVYGTLLGLGLGRLARLISNSFAHPLSQWVLNQLKRGYGKQIDYMAAIRYDMEILEEHLRQNDSRFLVVIDDLDRCHPRKAVEVLEAIKLLLDFDRFVICLGVDARIITRAIEKYYEDMLGPTGASGYEYLDKIIQVPFRIPEATPSEVEFFLRMQMSDPKPWLEEVILPEDPGSLTTYLGDAYRSVTADSVVDSMEPMATAAEESFSPRLAVPFTYAEFEAFQAFVIFLKPNPRHLKRLVNVYRLVRTLADYRREDLILRRVDATVRWLVMCSQWPYTSSLMLHRFDDIMRVGVLPDSHEDPLLSLFNQVESEALPEKLERLDHEPSLLKLLLQTERGRLSWDELRILRQYTINFNPAVESELKSALGQET